MITSAPAATTTVRTPTITFGSDQQGVTFECSLDGGAFTACGSPITLPGGHPSKKNKATKLAIGPHTFTVRAISGTGVVDQTPATVTFNVAKRSHHRR